MPATYRPRPPRFPIHAPLQYRKSGEIDWHYGTTVNISRSGVLFHAENEIAPETVLEMKIVFPEEVTGDVPTRVICWGPVIRQVPPAAEDSRPGLAAAIFRYRFSRD